MLVVETEHPAGVIGVVGGELARYHAFTSCLSALNIPMESKGYFGLGYDVAYNRNGVIDYALHGCKRCGLLHEGKEQPGCRGFEPINPHWVQIWDDDHVFPPDTLLRLLDCHVDVVVPLYSQRTPPFRPCVFKSENPDGSYMIHSWVDFEGKSGVFPAVSAGAGGVLIKRHVLEKIPQPWFERQGKIGEDHYFFKKCLAAGFQPYVALDVGINHLTTVEVGPYRNDRGEWCGRVDLKGETQATVEYWDAKYGPATGTTLEIPEAS